jgi:hypothetical protein
MSASRDRADTGPWALDAFSIGLTAPGHKIQRKFHLAIQSMRMDMHFWNHEAEHRQDHCDLHELREFRHPLEQELPPLANDVI